MIGSMRFSNKGSYLISGSDDSFIKIWNLKTHACINTLSLREGELAQRGFISPAVLKCLLNKASHMIICDRSRFIYILSNQGDFIKSLKYDKNMSHFVDIALSANQGII